MYVFFFCYKVQDNCFLQTEILLDIEVTQCAVKRRRKILCIAGVPETDKGQTYCDVWCCDVVDEWSSRGHLIWKWKKVTLSDHIPCDGFRYVLESLMNFLLRSFLFWDLFSVYHWFTSWNHAKCTHKLGQFEFADFRVCWELEKEVKQWPLIFIF